jgi:hypothetical protein
MLRLRRHSVAELNQDNWPSFFPFNAMAFEGDELQVSFFLGFTVIQTLDLLLQTYESFHRPSRFAVVLTLSIVAALFNQVFVSLSAMSIAPVASNIISILLWIVMVQGCNWLCYYRSSHIFAVVRGSTGWLIVLPIIILVSQVVASALYILATFDVISFRVFQMDSLFVTLILLVLNEFLLYADLIKKMMGFPDIIRHIISSKRRVRICFNFLAFLSLDITMLVTAYFSDATTTLNMKAPSYLFRFALILDLLGESTIGVSKTSKSQNSRPTLQGTLNANLSSQQLPSSRDLSKFQSQSSLNL